MVKDSVYQCEGGGCYNSAGKHEVWDARNILSLDLSEGKMGECFVIIH